MKEFDTRKREIADHIHEMADGLIDTICIYGSEFDPDVQDIELFNLYKALRNYEGRKRLETWK